MWCVNRVRWCVNRVRWCVNRVRWCVIEGFLVVWGVWCTIKSNSYHLIIRNVVNEFQ